MHGFEIDHSPLRLQHPVDLAPAHEGKGRVDTVDSPQQAIIHRPEMGTVIDGTARYTEQYALAVYGYTRMGPIDHLPPLPIRDMRPGLEAKKSRSTSSWPIFRYSA